MVNGPAILAALIFGLIDVLMRYLEARPLEANVAVEIDMVPMAYIACSTKR